MPRQTTTTQDDAPVTTVRRTREAKEAAREAAEAAPAADSGAVTDELIARIAKEVVVKYIEVGKLTPAGFEEAFSEVHAAIVRTVRRGRR